MMSFAVRIRILSEKVLSKDWSTLKKTTFDYRRNTGEWQRQIRETYDRGNGAAILLYNLENQTVVLVRQFRYPAFANGYQELLIEVPAGVLADASPEDSIRKETEEETGFRVDQAHKVFEAFMSPGSVTEKLYFFVAEYSSANRISAGGGLHHEGEDIEVLELTFKTALQMIGDGSIQDAKTIMLLQHAALHIFAD
jgi:nudix-type nucleoside diphosphatase (YffH/AdpP family)